MKLLVVYFSAFLLEIGSTLYISSVAHQDLDRMMVWSFLGPFIALPFAGFIADEKHWVGRLQLALFSAMGYATGAYISSSLIS